MAGFLTFTLSVCLSVCVQNISKNINLTDQLHLWWTSSLWGKEETIRFWEKIEWGKAIGCVCGGGGEGGGKGVCVCVCGGFDPNDKR